MKKRIISLLLVLCLAVGMLCTAAFADSKPLYVALGDSIAAGYALEGFQPVSGQSGNLAFTVPAGCFANLIAADKGYRVQNLAVSGDDTTKLLERMQTKQYSDPLKQADIITLTIGSNDILAKALDLVMAKYLPGKTDHGIMATPGKGALLDGSLTEMMATLQSVNDYLNSKEVTDVLDASVKTFQTNWDTIIDTLKTWNPDATIIVTNYFNPYKILDLNFGTLKLNVGTLGQKYIDQLNAYITGNSRNGKSYTLVDVTKTTTNVKIDTNALVASYLGTAVDLTKAVNLDPHPDAAGHAYFAKQIEAVLPAVKAVVTAFADVKSDAWYAAPVSFAAQQKLVVGNEKGNFEPNKHMSIAEYMTVLYRYAYAAAPSVIPAKATTGADWMEAANYVNTELMGGKYANLNKDMTRYQMADITAAAIKLVATATGKAPNTRDTHGFADVADNASVQYLESIYGVDGNLQADGTYLFKGSDPIIRAEVAQVVYNIMAKSMA